MDGITTKRSGGGAEGCSSQDEITGTVEESPHRMLSTALPIRRVKNSKIGRTSYIVVDEFEEQLSYVATLERGNPFFACRNGRERKRVDLSEILEVRQGYQTDGFHRAARLLKFQQNAPEERCFSIIFRHPNFVCKSIDFISLDQEKTLKWVDSMKELLAKGPQQCGITFDERLWLLQNFRQADLDRNGEIAFSELWRLLKRLNLQLSEMYVQALFQQSISKSDKQRSALNENEFLQLFAVLTDLPEYRIALRLASVDGATNHLEAVTLQKFLSEEQHFKNVDVKKAEAIIDFCEPRATTEGQVATRQQHHQQQQKLLTVNGFRRLLQSRWGNILREGHETVFMDMGQPLHCYFINSSHNTYLTGLQVHGTATVEGYISALKRGSRLLELDIFDGDTEPQITHKRTFIGAISLRNALRAIRNYAFLHNPFPVILTLENHVGTEQQRIMADIFREILGEQLFIAPDDFHTKPLPSPNQLRKKFLLRGKGSQVLAAAIPAIESNVDGPEDEEQRTLPDDKRAPIDQTFGKLISLPSVKLTPGNLYLDIQSHPANGSASLSEGKVQTLFDSNAPIFAYTATHIVKSFPSGIRQDSSNMDPLISWLCGIQSVAMNFQTCDEGLDVNTGFFAINGNIGYVLKPKILLEGKDPRHSMQVKTTLEIAIICAQYLPKSDASSGIIDPYVSVEIYGVPGDKRRARTRAVHNNGFNPVWNENFVLPLFCPELALLRICVKDFDSTSADDFVGEFTVPVGSIRPGYSHIRLNTSNRHLPDEAGASIFIRTAFS